ncbi:MAG: hypothetical protein HOV80_24565 [Polyangiaceae bacterium]|nr:hypothetical protein [Polyangiaceae bacterium]
MTSSERSFLSLIFCAFGLLAGCSDDAEETGSGGSGGSDAGGGGGESANDPLAYLAAKAGTYEGSWEIYAVDAAQVRSLKYAWTDVAVADTPTVEATRAYLTVVDNMTFTVGFNGTQEQTWIEGILIEPSGALGQQFVETDGVLTIQIEVEPHHFVYETALTQYDLLLIEGCTEQNLIEGHHTIDKTVTFPDGIETHTISRTTHASCNATSGMITVDYPSLTGTHRKKM